MLRYNRQNKPGLVAFYDIRPGNGAGPFLQPRSPHGADMGEGRVVSGSITLVHSSQMHCSVLQRQLSFLF